MSYLITSGEARFPVWGVPDFGAIDQMNMCLRTAVRGALMADHHLGYSCPIGGVLAYQDAISPSSVGYDIACGNKAVLTDLRRDVIEDHMSKIMDEVFSQISFGVGRKNVENDNPSELALFDDHPAWDLPHVAEHKDMARQQLGTVGSGNHYVDIFYDECDRIWIGVHFGSRGLGHKIATHYINAGGGKNGMHSEPVVFSTNSYIGLDYLCAMDLAGQYAYAGRDWVCKKVAHILGAKIVDEVHNHHNYAWKERHFGEDLWVVRKGATPAFPGQRGFVGGSMGENSVILSGFDSTEAKEGLYSTVHGAGRVMSRTTAAGKSKWKNGKKVRVSEGAISNEMMKEWVVDRARVELRGGGVDESPHCYKRLSEVLDFHKESIQVIHTLTPMGVAMAGSGEFDPYKD
jgi:tRNA-splicing ligase RtcB